MKMLNRHVLLVLAVFCAQISPILKAADPVELAWPSMERSETRPWTWWWWHGCAVTKTDITANLKSLQKSGIGGVSIVCLLDVRDDQARKLGYLSKEWVEAIVHAKHEARRLGMDVDMSPVPGWAFGGPWVAREDSCAVVEVRQWKANPMPTLSPDDIRNLDAIVLVTADGQTLDLTGKMREAGGLGGMPPAPTGTYYAVITRRGSSGVRMPTADGSGWVVDHLSPSAVRNYFRPFDQAFAGLTSADLPRAFNNDSWEISLDWTPGLLDEFAKRRGYDLRRQLPAFAGQGSADLVSRVACDYRETVADLMLDNFTVTYKQWASGHGCRISGEVIDEPGNDLDLNMLYDIPQADIGGPPSWFFPDGDYATDKMFRCGKFAASPAHILGKPLIASETLTCLGPILDTPLEQAKEKIDYDLVAGINHTMFHGITYSPASVRWPGWLFYAGTHLGPFNPMWRQGKAFCDYVARCQSFLQAGRPDSDVLLYYPVHDAWSRRQPGEVSAPGVFGMSSPGPTVGEKLWRAGYDFDFSSDRLLESFKVIDGRLVSPGTTHRTLVISGCRLMPAKTLERIIQLADGGATVIFDGELPADVPGLGRLDQRRAIFKSALSKIESARAAAGPSGVGSIGKGKVIFTDNVLDAMVKSGIQREAMVDSRLRYVRRSDAQGTTYFITSLSLDKRVDGWIPVAATGESAAIFDPMTGAMGIAEFRKSAAGGSLVRLQLEPRESRIVRVLNAVPAGPAWPYLAPAGDPIPLTGSWNVRFLEGGETIPHEETIDKLASWTEWKSDQAGALRAFSGVASYTLKFPTPRVSADAWAIDLGDVCHTARVRLNGTLLGDLFCRPMRVTAAALAKDGRNILEIEVANAPINRAADLDIRGIVWQKTMGEDASSYRIGDFLFNWSTKDAKWVPRPSGLLGPVRLIPLAKQQPSTAVDVTDLRCEYLKDPLGIDVVKLDSEAWDRLATWIDLNTPAHGTWTEIVGAGLVTPQRDRRREMLKRYAQRDEDPEEISGGPAKAIAFEPRATGPPPPVPARVELRGWPFDAAEARRRQAENGTFEREINLGNGVRLDFVLIPKGEFIMGDTNSEPGPRCVTIANPFWMGRFEISNEQYAQFDSSHDSRIERGDFLQFSETERGYPANGPRQPVVRVSWNEAIAFCRWLSEKTGERCALPTEAQWEYACRAGTATALWFGGLETDFSEFANLADHSLRAMPTFGWGLPSGAIPPWRPAIDSVHDKFRISAPVGSFEPNAWGLCDMHGNVWEWTAGDFNRDRKTVRGGSWWDRPFRATSASRLGYRPWQRVYDVGFRVMINASNATEYAAAMPDK